MSNYAISEIFDSFQGEGTNTGRRAVFVRFTGCNLWSGDPAKRSSGKGACARWCDTDFASGTKYTAEGIIEEINALWPDRHGRFVVLSGGEPTLQVDGALLLLLGRSGWEIAIETNGTNASHCLTGVDHVCVSPKLGGDIEVHEGAELKVVLPGHTDFDKGWTDEQLEQLAKRGTWDRMYVQPQDPINPEFIDVSHLHKNHPTPTSAEKQFQRNYERCLEFIRAHPEWRLSLQTHKFIDQR